MSERRYKAAVRFVIEIQADGVWGENFTVKQIEGQASRETEDQLRAALDHVKSPYSSPIIHSCSVDAVIVYPEKRKGKE